MVPERIQEVVALAGNVAEAAPAGAAAGAGGKLRGREFLVTVIRPGEALSGRVYSQQACSEIARQLEGARAFADHLTKSELRERAERSIRDMVGYYHGASVAPDGSVQARLRLLEHAAWLGQLLAGALEHGRGDLVGISIDALVDVDRSPGRPPTVVGCQRLLSADVVTRPSAGGRIERMVASDRDALGERGDGLDAAGGGAGAGPLGGAAGARVGMLDPGAAGDGDPGAVTAAGALEGGHEGGHGGPPLRVAEATRVIEAARADLEQARRELEEQRQRLEHERRLVACERALEASCARSSLPPGVLELVRRRFAGRVFEQAELDAELREQQELLASLAQSGVITGMGYERPTVSGVRAAIDRLQEAVDATFDVHLDGGVVRNGRRQGVRAFESIRELYAVATGDHEVRGFGPNIRALESERVAEADTTTASFSYLLGTSMNRKLLAEYQSWPAEWQKWCTIVPIKDFKQQQRVRLGAFGSLSTVAEDTAYTTLSLSDVQATYSATKRGNLVQISRETIVNDDLQGVKQIPTKLAIAAAYTLAEFVYNFVLSTSNPAIYDGFALFNAAQHGNYGSGATLTTANVEAGVTAMRKQTNSAGKRLGIRPAFLIVPPELEFTALTIVRSAGIPGSNNNDINPMMGYMDVIVSPQLTAAAQWILSADPRVVDTVEVGFVGGQVNPELFIQDNPLYGLNFTQDVISYKVRHEYGAAVVDYRGLYSGF